MTYNFKTHVEAIGKIVPPDDILMDEPMIYSCDPEHARRLGGPLTNAILNEIFEKEECIMIPKDHNLIIDTKLVMLMPGFYPCIGGWHADAIDRRYGQPDLSTLDSNRGVHWIYQQSTGEHGTGSQTEFLTQDLVMPEFSSCDENVWALVNRYIGEVDPPVRKATDGVIYKMGGTTLHRGTPALRAGWRYFFRMSLMKSTPRNEVRKQVQVYNRVEEGW